MRKRLLVFVTLLLSVLFFGATEAMSQICRVCDGVDSSGSRRYIEVYQYDYVSVKPEFPGGDEALFQFINKTRVYPRQAYKRRVEGRVTCAFVVNSDGSVSHIKVIRGVEASLDEEALRVLSLMPTWRPGSVEGRPVPVRVVRSINFRR